jgi:hypothetical protein
MSLLSWRIERRISVGRTVIRTLGVSDLSKVLNFPFIDTHCIPSVYVGDLMLYMFYFYATYQIREPVLIMLHSYTFLSPLNCFLGVMMSDVQRIVSDISHTRTHRDLLLLPRRYPTLALLDSCRMNEISSSNSSSSNIVWSNSDNLGTGTSDLHCLHFTQQRQHICLSVPYPYACIV